MQKWIAQDCEREQFSKAESENKENYSTESSTLGKKTRKISGLRLRGDVYYADTTANGVRISERIGKVPESVARGILSKLISDSFAGKHFPKKETTSIQLRDICIEYVEKKLSFVKSKETRMHLFKPLDRLLGNRIAKDLRISDVEEYRRIRLSEKKTIAGRPTDRPVSISTVNHEVKELLSALRWATRERLLEFNPIAGIEHLKEPDPKKIMLDKGKESGMDWLRLYNSIGEKHRSTGKLTIRGKKDRLKFLIQYKTGMRIGEVNAIEHSWIDQVNRYIYLPAEATKAQRAREIPIDLETIQAINSYRIDATNTKYAHDKYLFYNPKTGSHDKRSYKAFNNAVKRAGLSKEITSHALRRTRGTIWDGIDERASMEVLGHSDHKVHRKHYTEVTEDRIKRLTGDIQQEKEKMGNE
jgi:integrase